MSSILISPELPLQFGRLLKVASTQRLPPLLAITYCLSFRIAILFIKLSYVVLLLFTLELILSILLFIIFILLFRDELTLSILLFNESKDWLLIWPGGII